MNFSNRLQRVVNYNEKKVQEGKATCIAAEGYPKDVDQLNFHEKIAVLKKRAQLNPSIDVNVVHISLSFAPEEKFSHEKLAEITADYMRRIGFGEQPYLLYNHSDTANTHVHIVTTNIRRDGSGISLHNIGRDVSEPARQETEKRFGLVEATGHGNTPHRLEAASFAKASAGEKETRQEIRRVLNAVLDRYNFTTLGELNAVLSLYNVKADRGTATSRSFLHGGLYYRILDDKGNKTETKPIKASNIRVRVNKLKPEDEQYQTPTLAFLNERLPLKKQARQKHKLELKNKIDLLLLDRGKRTLDDFIRKMAATGVDVMLRKNADGFIYGITYVDHVNRSVFNGNALDTNYSAKAILERCAPLTTEPKEPIQHREQPERTITTPYKTTKAEQDNSHANEQPSPENEVEPIATEWLETLLQSEGTDEYVPYHMRANMRRRKKRKKK